MLGYQFHRLPLFSSSTPVAPANMFSPGIFFPMPITLIDLAWAQVSHEVLWSVKLRGSHAPFTECAASSHRFWAGAWFNRKATPAPFRTPKVPFGRTRPWRASRIDSELLCIRACLAVGRAKAGLPRRRSPRRLEAGDLRAQFELRRSRSG